jgi:tellurite resistance protein TerC
VDVPEHAIGSPHMWITFVVVVVAVLALDLGVVNRSSHKQTMRGALLWAGFCIGLAVAFNIWILFEHGHVKAVEFTTAYLLEEALSIDNLFVFLILFRALAVPAEHQHRVLFWGILGAVLTRGAFIAAGTALVQSFSWIFWVFGSVLLVTGARLLLAQEQEPHPERSPVLRAFRRVIPMTGTYHGGAFVVREAGRTLATPLLLALVMAEFTDIVFAVDSIPAVFGLWSNPRDVDPFIVYTSNIFAILGLRSLYFLLAGIMDRFHYLKVGLAFVLMFIGAKMLASEAFGWHVSTGWSLLVLLVLVGGAIVASLLRPQRAPEG